MDQRVDGRAAECAKRCEPRNPDGVWVEEGDQSGEVVGVGRRGCMGVS